jgi:sec-independent protein translocase protein TatC
MPLTMFRRDDSTRTSKDFNPDDFRMTVGEHLEDLRKRLILALVGFVLAAVVCLFLGKDVIIPWFAKPLTDTLQKYGLPPQLHSDEVPDVFSTFLTISMICAAAISSPWIVYQFWQFIAAGLYPKERAYITRHVPLSIGLLVAGMVFVYVLVLPWTIEFFLVFSMSVPLRGAEPPPTIVATTQPAPRGTTFIQQFDGRPKEVREGQIWYDRRTKRVEAVLDNEIRILRFSADNLIATEYKLDAYIDLVIGMLITFGLSFQLPLIVLALVRTGIMERQALKDLRRYIYFGIAVLSAAITPGDTITATVLLTFPLILLYELGIWLSREPKTPQTPTPPTPPVAPAA